MRVDGQDVRTVWWEDGAVRMIDQPALPHRFRIVTWRTVEEVAVSISTMVVRGAGAIGATGALGLALGAQLAPEVGFREALSADRDRLADTRPTAQNLFYGLDRVFRAALAALSEGVPAARAAALREGRAVADEDAAACQAIGRHGAPLITPGMGISTHCNAGWLAFVDWGSALSPIFTAHRQGVPLHVFVDETRPRSQGSRLTAWELANEGVPHHVVADNAAGFLMARGEIQLLITGADRIARNGDVANKIGTYSSAVVAARHDIPFYVCAPTSTLDPACHSGAQIPIEERDQEEVLHAWGETDSGELGRVRVAPRQSPARNLAFDVTPASLVAGLITEHGIFPASLEGVRDALRAAGREAEWEAGGAG